MTPDQHQSWADATIARVAAHISADDVRRTITAIDAYADPVEDGTTSYDPDDIAAILRLVHTAHIRLTWADHSPTVEQIMTLIGDYSATVEQVCAVVAAEQDPDELDQRAQQILADIRRQLHRLARDAVSAKQAEPAPQDTDLTAARQIRHHTAGRPRRAGSDPRRPTHHRGDPMTRGTCPHCGRQIALRQDGTLRHHLGDRYWGGWREVCPGKGQPPKETR